MKIKLTLAGCFAGLLLCATPALADPCEAPLPARGQSFEGMVRYVGDGDSLCVSDSHDPRTWIEVRLADFYAPELHAAGGREAKAMLQQITRGRRLICVADHRSYDRIVASCSIDGVDVGDLLRRTGEREGGNGFRRR